MTQTYDEGVDNLLGFFYENKRVLPSSRFETRAEAEARKQLIIDRYQVMLDNPRLYSNLEKIEIKIAEVKRWEIDFI